VINIYLNAFKVNTLIFRCKEIASLRFCLQSFVVFKRRKHVRIKRNRTFWDFEVSTVHKGLIKRLLGHIIGKIIFTSSTLYNREIL